MKHTVKILMLFCLLTLGSKQTFVKAQSESPIAYLERNFPQLTELFKDELSNYPAHYIFAVDVSGTMNKYETMVSSALTPFFQALPDKDRVDVIPFGTDAKISMLGYSGVIDNNVKNTLCTNIKSLYQNSSYSSEFKAHTDIKSAVDGIAKVVQNNRDYKVNIIVIMTDFRNDQKGLGECKLKEDALKSMKTAISAATDGVYTRFIALELPVNQAAPGYCLNQLRDQVFASDDSSLEIASIGNDANVIGQWFEQLKRDIMTTKLKAIVHDANKNTPVRLGVEKDIDGNVVAEVHWVPSKLYPTIKIDSTYIDGEAFYFENNTENFTQTRDSVINLELGQIKHNSYGFHELKDKINLGLSLPTPYDHELKMLEAEKPLPATTVSDDGWIFTFFLSFQTTMIILILIILYILGVIKAIARNAKLTFSGKVVITDNQGTNNTISLNKVKDRAIVIGAGGSHRCSVSGASWSFKIEKVNGNPFLLFDQPRYTWKCTVPYVVNGKKSSGNINGIVKFDCGKSRTEKTHRVTIQYFKSK